MLNSATAIIQTLRHAGHEAVFAGGCVRDMLLGKEPKDYDIATSARPEDIQRLFPGSQDVGAHFGVIIVRKNGNAFEVATFRQDGTYHDGRRPESVTFTNAEEDAKRRDFTVNGLFYDPVATKILDYVGGQEDLQRQLLKAIGTPQERFQEDHLRLMRAVRFATVLDFQIEERTWQAVCELSHLISHVSVERVRDEFVRTMMSPNRVRGFDLLVESGLMTHVLPEILNLMGCEQPPQFHPEGDVFTHTRIMLGLLAPDASLPLILSVLLHDIAKPATFTRDETGRIRFNGHDKLGADMSGDIMRRLKFPNTVIDQTVEAVANHMAFKDVQQMRASTLKRFMARPHFDDEMELHRVDCSSSNGLLDNYEFVQTKAAEFALQEEPLIPAPLVTGRDLIGLGLTPGPRFRELLTAVQTQQLEGSLTSRDAAISWLQTQLP